MTHIVLLLPLLGTTPQTKDEVKRTLLLDVVIRECPPILELLPGEDESLLIRWDTFLVLDLGFDVVDRV